jgi:hypothetical protein
LWNSDREHESGLSGLSGIIPAIGSHRYRHICGCSKSGNPFVNLVAALLIDLRQAQEAGVSARQQWILLVRSPTKRSKRMANLPYPALASW